MNDANFFGLFGCNYEPIICFDGRHIDRIWFGVSAFLYLYFHGIINTEWAEDIIKMSDKERNLETQMLMIRRNGKKEIAVCDCYE